MVRAAAIDAATKTQVPLHGGPERRRPFTMLHPRDGPPRRTHTRAASLPVITVTNWHAFKADVFSGLTWMLSGLVNVTSVCF